MRILFHQVWDDKPTFPKNQKITHLPIEFFNSFFTKLFIQKHGYPLCSKTFQNGSLKFFQIPYHFSTRKLKQSFKLKLAWDKKTNCWKMKDDESNQKEWSLEFAKSSPESREKSPKKKTSKCENGFQKGKNGFKPIIFPL